MPRTKAFEEKEALEKAMQVFWKKGYHATSMEDLVVCMGINRASLYDTFGDKKQLYMAALKHFQGQSQRTNRQIMARHEASPKAQIIAIMEGQLEDALNDGEQKGCLLANATSEMALLDADICQFVQNNISAVEQTFENLIRQAQARGEINADLPPQYAANFLSNFVHGMRTVTKTNPDATKMREGLKLALRVLG